MKKLIILSVILMSLVSCRQEEKSSHQMKWSNDQKDSVVYVNYRGEDGQMNSFFMNYLMFRMLFNNGGYSSVNNYYSSHRSEFSNYSKFGNYGEKKITLSSSSPSRSAIKNGEKATSITNRILSSPSRSHSSPTKSYSSPSSSKSYSSPSRSYSTTSRSYSSPSRSYSSPSRSYSSPSRSR